jgi:hypothetical protein
LNGTERSGHGRGARIALNRAIPARLGIIRGVGEADRRPLDYAGPAAESARRGRINFVLQFIWGFIAAVLVVLLLIPATGEGPMIPAVVRAIETVVGPAAAVLLAVAIFARWKWGRRGLLAGVLVGFALAGLIAGLCVPMLEP